MLKTALTIGKAVVSVAAGTAAGVLVQVLIEDRFKDRLDEMDTVDRAGMVAGELSLGCATSSVVSSIFSSMLF